MERARSFFVLFPSFFLSLLRVTQQKEKDLVGVTKIKARFKQRDFKSATRPRARAQTREGFHFFYQTLKNYFYDFKLLRAPSERTIALRFSSARLLFPFQNQN
jgi:hypothetical protein